MEFLALLLAFIPTTVAGSFPEDNLKHTDELHPDEVLIEGDILVKKNELSNFRNAIRNRHYLWAQRTLIYQISNSFSAAERMNIRQSMDIISQRTGCIKFKNRDREPDYVTIKLGNGCWSYIGERGGNQTLELSHGCANSLHTIIHELMHALGVYHEHQRYDRDRYITIHWNNIQSNNLEGDMYSKSTSVAQVFRPFDFWSTMLYEPTAHAKSPGLITISSKVAGQRVMYNYERPVMSEGDVKTLNGLYRC